MLSHIRVRYDNNVVLHLLSIFRISFSQRLTLSRILRTSDQMHLRFTSGINNNEKKCHDKSYMTNE